MLYSIEVGGRFLVFTDGSLALAIIANAQVFERDGYHSNAGFKRCADSLGITTHQPDVFAEDSAATKAAKNRANELKTRWLGEYNKRAAQDKELAELKAQVAVLSSLKTCVSATEPAPPVADNGD